MGDVEEDGDSDPSSPRETMEAMDDGYPTPGPLDRFTRSIERDLSDQTTEYRTVVGVGKRATLRGLISGLVALSFSTLVALLTFVLGFHLATIPRVFLVAFVTLWPLLYSTMLTDWLPSVD